MRGSHPPLREASADVLAETLLSVVDAAGSALLAVAGDGTVVLANARAAELFRGSFPEDIDLERARYDVAHLLAPLEVLLRSQAADGSGRPRLEVHHGGTRRIFGYTIHPTRAPNDPPLYAVVFSDLTQVLELEEERDRLLKLATVGEVMPMLLHETKNPLSAAVTTLELLLEERSEPALVADLHAVLVEIRRAVLTLDGLGSAARSFRSTRHQAIDFAIREVCSLLEARASRHGVRMRCDVHDLPLLPFDASCVRGVVLNLVTNAIHACGPGCTVEVRLRLEASRLVLEVADDGAGMPREILERCRELFFTTKQKGSGIGLALCNRLVQDAGGTLSIDSTPRVGTTVSITLPLSLTDAPTAGVTPPIHA